MGSPWFPMLFISEATKNVAYRLIAGAPALDVTAASLVMAFASVVLWLYSYDEVKWGLQKAAEAAEEVTDDE